MNPYAHDIANECSHHECSTCLLYEAWSEGYAAARTELEAILRAQAEAVIASLRETGKDKSDAPYVEAADRVSRIAAMFNGWANGDRGQSRDVLLAIGVELGVPF